ncbi:hypothetical protein ACWJXY_16160 [Clostridioides difficile]
MNNNENPKLEPKFNNAINFICKNWYSYLKLALCLLSLTFSIALFISLNISEIANKITNIRNLFLLLVMLIIFAIIFSVLLILFVHLYDFVVEENIKFTKFFSIFLVVYFLKGFGILEKIDFGLFSNTKEILSTILM